MNLGAVLNSDVGSLRVAALSGIHWWFGQIRELLRPIRRRHHGPRQFLLWDDGALRVLRKDGSPGRMPAAGSRVALALPQHLAFIRTLQLPRVSAADLRRLVELEAERLSPLPASESIVGIEASNDEGVAPVEIAVLPLALAREAITAARAAELGIAGFGLIGPGGSVRFDFMPALRDRGLLAARGSPAAIWWSLVGFAFLLNVAVLVIRDQQSVKRLAEVAEQQAPAVVAARAMQARAGGFAATARDLQTQRRDHDVLSTLAVVSQNLPAAAWVQRFSFTSQTARLVGYKRKDVDVVAALRKDRRIASVRSNTSQLVTETPVGQPFDLTIQMRGGR